MATNANNAAQNSPFSNMVFGNRAANNQPAAGQTFTRGGKKQRVDSDGNPLPDAKLWLNVGYLAPQIIEGETERRFVALGQGIALDTMADVDVRGSGVFRAMLTAQNDLRDEVLEEAKALQPGQSAYIGNPDDMLMIQIRRVNDEAATIDPESNPFSRRNKLSLVTPTGDDHAE